MMRKLVREVAKKHGLTHSQTFDMLVDFLESLIETDKIATQDLIDYFEEEIVEAAKAGEWDEPKVKFLVQPCLDFGSTVAVAPPAPLKVETERLDADTKEVVKFLLGKQVRVDTPVDVKFIGDKKAVVALMSVGYFKRQVAVVTRVGGKLVATLVNFDNPVATVE